MDGTEALTPQEGRDELAQPGQHKPPSIPTLAGADSLGLNKSSFSLPFPLREAGATSEMLLSH